MAFQRISNRYINLEALLNLLTTKFGVGNFEILEGYGDGDGSVYEFEVPERLTEASSRRTSKVEGMEELRQSIRDIRSANKNSEGHRFIPEVALFEVVSESAVKLSLQDLGTPVHEIGDLTNDILRGARKCFGILVCIRRGEAISAFFRRDALQETCPDDRLPYNSESLKQAFSGGGEDPAIQEFLETQWEFAIPILRPSMIFRELDTEVILPFLQEKPVGRGSAGTVSKIELHPQCHRLPLPLENMVIRKEMEYEQKNKEYFVRELRNLSLLSGLKHPNIIQLHCSYIYRGKCNLIFSVADGGSLAEFLKRQQNPNGPDGPPQLLLALAGLASAIDALHDFTSETPFDLRLSGIHHDLAPRNILVHGDRFLLADFGLSTLRDAEQDSLTTFKDAHGTYAAPECQTMHDGHIKADKIGRASDIWSFGCILLEVLTYAVLGVDGVDGFRLKRKFQLPLLTWTRFHGGPGKTNPEVILWMDQLQARQELYCIRMVGLIRKMLSMDPKERPRSGQVLMLIRGISVLSIADSTNLGLDKACKARGSVDCVLAHMRFQSWLFAFNRLFDEVDRDEPWNRDFDFSKTVETLKEMQHILASNQEEPIDLTDEQHSLLRYHHAKLVNALPPHCRDVVKEHLVQQVLRSGMQQLDRFSTPDNKTVDKDIRNLAAIKHLTTLAEMGHLTEQKTLLLEQGSITIKYDVDIHTLALLEPNLELVLVEWLKYDESWADKNIGRELRNRLASVVSLLHDPRIPRIPGSLHCKGFFHDMSRAAFGVVHGLPLSGAQSITLHGLLRKDKSYNPPLEDRFRLAFDICQCISTLHKIGWLHRNLHSMNVLLFPPQGAGNAEWAKEPRILGFAGGRENLVESFSHGPVNDRQLRSYQHPEYLMQKTRYCEEFDYYSVGMLLLEIGLWKKLSTITDSKRFEGKSDEEFRREVIETRVPHLRVTMGTRYMEATRACLDGEFERVADTCYMSFKHKVMDRIPMIE